MWRTVKITKNLPWVWVCRLAAGFVFSSPFKVACTLKTTYGKTWIFCWKCAHHNYPLCVNLFWRSSMDITSVVHLQVFIRRHLLEKLDDRIFWRFFFSTVGGGIKKNTLTLTKARKEWKKYLPFIDCNTPFATTNSLWELQYYLRGWSVCCCGIVHAPGTWKGLLYSG